MNNMPLYPFVWIFIDLEAFDIFMVFLFTYED